MAEKIELNVGDVLTPVEVADADGIIIGRAKINVLDDRVASRMRDLVDYIRGYPFEGMDAQKRVSLDKSLEAKFCYLFGYDCRATLFGVLRPTDTTGSGEMFALMIVNALNKNLPQKMKERAEARAQAIEKYAEKYKK